MTMLLVLGVLYYFKVLGFIYGVAFSGGGNLLDASLEGNPVNKFSGILIIMMSLFCLLYTNSIQKISFWKKTSLMWIIPLFCFLSIFWSVEPSYTLKRSIALFALFLFSLHLTHFYKEIDLLYFLGCTISACAVAGLVIGLLAPSLVFLQGGIRGGAFIGILADKNAGARLYAIGITILFPYLLQGNRKVLFIIMPIILALLLSKSASGVALCGIGVLTILYFNLFPFNRNSSNYIGQVLLSLIGYVLLGVALYLVKEVVFILLERDSDLTDRKVIWDIITPYVEQKHWLGYGFGAFWTSGSALDFIERWGFIGNAHNGYIETKLDGGVVFLYLTNGLIFLSMLKSLVYIPKESRSNECSVSLAIMVIVLVANSIAHVIPNYYAADFFLLIIVMFLSLSFRGQESEA
ncbi:O-antigen ligase family protein [Motilimonas cestriensis]|uniref:O-antigen ligase family protein n=1 Tax=Motilimonas cestriensis TaxID=2742685 RepID=A0ABS8W8X2_9GAMM|nr:O-antigen ligase family protein [Motilimonas cestriensis]MCE2594720.1 O-antigen ligase family protein [Motilimonas cestriensis]